METNSCGDARYQRRTRVGPFLTDLKSENYSIPDFEPLQLHRDATLAKIELVDAWGRPLEYDKLKTRRSFSKTLFDGNASNSCPIGA